MVNGIICFESEGYYQLLKETIERFKKDFPKQMEKYILEDQVMSILNIGKSSLQKLRDSGEIEFSKPSKVIYYDYESIISYQDRHRK